MSGPGRCQEIRFLCSMRHRSYHCMCLFFLNIFSFQQCAENSAPDGGPMQTWVEKILREMQRSIDAHISAAMA